MKPGTNLIDAKTLPELTAEAGRRWPDEIGLVFDETGDRLTFAEIDARSNAFAHALVGLGIEPGDRVAVMLRNRPEFALAWLGITKAGAAMVPLNVFYRAADAGYLLAHSGAKVLITADEFRPVIAVIEPEGLALQHLCVIDRDADDGDALAFPPLLAAAPSDPPGVVVRPEMLASVQYTSGTTGRPKGCMMTHCTWLTTASVMARGLPGFGVDDVLLTAQPFYYGDFPWNLTCTLLSGATLVALDRFHPSTLWSKIQEYDATFFYCLGVMPTLLMRMPVRDDEHDHRLRMVAVSGLPSDLRQPIVERFGVKWYEFYGLTETGWCTHERPGEQDDVCDRACIGRAAPDREIRIVDADGRPLAHGEKGEIIVRGPGMSDGYFREPDATAEVSHEGWFRTGDLGWMDEQGRVFFAGRVKDIIRRSGENISATEVEEVVGTHPAVALAACLPVPDDLRGEEVKTYVVLAEGYRLDQNVTPSELIAHCDARIAYFKIPRYWTFRDSLPRTASEKIAKGELRTETDDLRVGAYDRVDDTWR